MWMGLLIDIIGQIFIYDIKKLYPPRDSIYSMKINKAKEFVESKPCKCLSSNSTLVLTKTSDDAPVSLIPIPKRDEKLKLDFRALLTGPSVPSPEPASVKVKSTNSRRRGGRVCRFEAKSQGETEQKL